jgi:ADP-ribose pyrophosphatase
MTEKNEFTHNDYEIVNREVLYQGVFRLLRYHIRQRLFNGGWSEVYKRELLERYPAAGVLPYDPKLDRVILIEQFRPGSLADPKSPWLVEIPAGILVTDESPEELVRRESIEEANCLIQEIEFVCDFYVSPGGSNEYLHLYCGKTDARDVAGVHGLKYEHEDIRVLNIPAEEAFAKLHSGQIKTSPAIITLLWLQIHRNRLRELWG